MSVSNLTNTIWVFRDTFVFSQSGTYSINFTSGGNSYTSIGFANYSSGKYVDYDNTRVFGSTPNTWISQGYRIIKITGGNDVTNSTLIAWFNTVAKQISVEDLSNTSWVFDNDWIYADDLTSKSINFTSNGNNYTEISVSTFHSGDAVNIYYGNTNVYECDTDEGINSWLDNQYRLISITDGIDTNNPDLMLLLATYATQVASANNYDLSYNLTNLTNGNVSLTFVADTGYDLPSTITVSNGTLVSWNQSTGVAVISGYSNNTSVSVSCVVAASGYSGSVSSKTTYYLMTPNSTKIKFGSAPASTNDYDAMVSDGGTFTGATSYSGQTILYAWSDNNSGAVEINGNTSYITSSYSNPTEITLTGDYTIYLLYA